MRITFGQEQTGTEKLDVLQTRPAGEARAAHTRADYKQAAGAYFKEGDSFFLQDRKRRQKTEKAMDFSAQDLQNQQDYMTLMSNTLSKEDYAKLSEDGYDIKNMEPDEAVTILDKIKAQLVRSGTQVEGFTDDLDMETLSDALGGDMALAQSLVRELAMADVPVQEETFSEIGTAWDMAQSLEVPKDGTYRYMVDNDMDTAIYDFYLAKSSSSDMPAPGSAKYISQDVSGYFAKAGSDVTEIDAQLDSVIAQAGLEVNERTKEEVRWLAAQNLPITPEGLQTLHELKGVTFPVEKEHFVKSVAAALAQGKSPVQADLANPETIFERANRILERYRQVEEVRLEMTAEVNVKLLKSGFSFDTASIEDVLENIRQAKEEIARNYFPDSEQPVESYDLFEKAKQVVQEIPQLPAMTVARTFLTEAGEPTVEEFHAEGAANARRFKEAGESYETLMTQPRADMGDSIRKAFTNVDDILKSLQLEPTDANRQAVRILGYNRMEITPQNIETVKEACRQVESVVEKMTPASTLRMIREGINPLEKSFAQLEEYFRQTGEEYENTSESYSRYLYGLEQRSQISQEERESYIGIYRMLRMIEKGDQASIGAVVNMQADLNFSNLLSANRTLKAKNLDIRLKEDFGTLKELHEKGVSISAQLETAFVARVREGLTRVVAGEEQQAAYMEEQYQALDWEQAASGRQQAALLEKGEIPQTLWNMQAASDLLEQPKAPFDRLRKRWEELPEEERGTLGEALTGEELVDALDSKEAFQEQYQDMVEEAATLAENMTEMSDTSLDVKSMQLVHKQLTILGKLSAKEEYFLPMELDGKMETVHLTVESTDEKLGMTDMRASFGESVLEAHLELREEKVSGYLMGNGDEEVMILEKAADIFSDWLTEETSWSMDAKLQIGNGQRPVSDKTGAAGERDEEWKPTANGDLYRMAKGLLQALKRAM